MPMKFSLLARRETSKLNRIGQLERWVIFEYMLDEFGPFIFEAPKAGFTYDLLKADVKREEEGLASLRER